MGAEVFYDANPDIYFYLFDSALALCIYGISIVLFLTYKRGNLGPILFLGLFIFPLQFSIWFLQRRINLPLPGQINVLELLYLLFVKFSVLFTLLWARR
jgi:hypothetical protein